MKVCTVAHVAPGFGEVPVGSLWADDSDVVDACPDMFDEVDPEPTPAPKPKTKKGDR